MLKILILLVFTSLTYAGKSPNGAKFYSDLTPEEIRSIPDDIKEDSLLDVPGLITKYGFVAETHEVETLNGYIVTLHRIVGRYGEESRERKIPVLMMHGLQGSSSDWVVNGPQKSFAYILADHGYDVWLGNARGNYYSRKHVSLNPNTSRKFWMFSWNEIGQIDLPIMIDYILEKTGQEKLHYVGHSQGTTVFFVMASSRPEYNDKILSMQAYGPAAYMTNSEGWLIREMSRYGHAVQYLFTLIGYNEWMPKTNFLSNLAHKHCHLDSKYLDFCVILMFGNGNLEQVNKTMMPVYLSHAPAGAASRQFIHYGQLYLSDKFRNYDYGFFANIAIYGTPSPPKYPLKKITAPVTLHYGENDGATTPLDTFRLNNELKNSVLRKVPDEKFTHLDFLWAINADIVLYDETIRIMKSFE